MKKIIMKNTFWCGAASFVSIGIGVFLLPFMVLKLGAQKYGLVAIINMFTINGLMALFQLGFQGGIARYVAKFNQEELFSDMFSVVTTAAIVFLIMGAFFAGVGLYIKTILLGLFHIEPSLMGEMSIAFNVVCLSYLFTFPSVIFIGYFQGLQKFEFLKIPEIIAFVIYAIFVVFYLTANGSSVDRIILFYICTQCMKVFFYCFVFLKNLMDQKVKFKLFDKSKLLEVWGMAKYLFLGNIGSLLYHNFPRFATAFFFGPVYMTSYDIVVKIPRVLKVAFGFVNGAVLPAASVLSVKQDKARIRKLTLLGLKYKFVFILPIVIVGILGAQKILFFWMSDEYAYLYRYLQIMFLWNIVITFASYIMSVLTGMQRQLKRMSFFVWLSFLVSACFIILFVKFLGFGAIVMGYVLGIFVWIPFVFIWGCNETYIKRKEILGLFLKSIPSSLMISFVFLVFNKWTDSFLSFMVLSLTCVICLFFMLVFTCLKKEDREFFYDGLSKFKIKKG